MADRPSITEARGDQADKSRGQSIVETALVAPVVLFLLVALADVGSMFYAFVTIDNSTRETASYIARNPNRYSEYQTRFISESNFLDPASLAVQPPITTTEGVTVTATYTVTTLFIGPLSQLLVGWWSGVAIPTRIPLYARASFRQIPLSDSEITPLATPGTSTPTATATATATPAATSVPTLTPTATPACSLLGFGTWLKPDQRTAAIDITNNFGSPVTIQQITLIWSKQHDNLQSIGTGSPGGASTAIWTGSVAGTVRGNSSTATISSWSGFGSRTIAAGATMRLTFGFQSNFNNGLYSLCVVFDNTCTGG